MQNILPNPDFQNSTPVVFVLEKNKGFTTAEEEEMSIMPPVKSRALENPEKDV